MAAGARAVVGFEACQVLRDCYDLEGADGEKKAVFLDRRAGDQEQDDPADRSLHGRERLADQVDQLADHVPRRDLLIDADAAMKDALYR
jgi:hypothetical protein